MDCSEGKDPNKDRLEMECRIRCVALLMYAHNTEMITLDQSSRVA